LAAAALFLAYGAASAQSPWHGGPGIAPPVQGNSDQVQLGRAIAVKFASPDFAVTRYAPNRIPNDSYSVPEEQEVRKVRDRIALARHPPADAKVLTVPRAATAPSINGMGTDSEWRGALRLALEPAARGASVLLLAHGAYLYIAALAPGDRTEEGFDQFRFWYHLDLSPYMTDERLMITARGPTRTLRGVRLPREGEPIRDGADPRSLRQDSDWGVTEKSRGLSLVVGYRRYWAAVHLADAGIGAGVTFPAFFEIEGDPVMEGGKFKARFNEGQLGSARQPLWLRVPP